MIFRQKKVSKVIKVPRDKQAVVRDDCFVTLRLPDDIKVEIPATFTCYLNLEKAFNKAYGFTNVGDKKPLSWFVNEYILHDYSMNVDYVIIVINYLLYYFLESNHLIKKSDFKAIEQMQVLADLLVLLGRYCIGGSDAGKKHLISLQKAMMRRNQKTQKVMIN